VKKFLLFISVPLLIISGCKSDDTVVNNVPSEVRMFSPAISDSIGTTEVNAYILKTANLGSTFLNFLDRDSTRISFLYKGSGSLSDTLFYIETGKSRLYTLLDAAPGNEYKSINVTVPSIKVNDLFKYTLYAHGDLPYVAIKDLNVYKK
jgi:hypothetical protein